MIISLYEVYSGQQKRQPYTKDKAALNILLHDHVKTLNYLLKFIKPEVLYHEKESS